MRLSAVTTRWDSEQGAAENERILSAGGGGVATPPSLVSLLCGGAGPEHEQEMNV